MPHFELCLANLHQKFNIIGLSETWIKQSNSDLCNLDGYNHEYVYRKCKPGGGVSLLIKNGIEYIPRTDLNIMNNYIETIFVEINKVIFNSTTNIVVGVLYRPPNEDINQFLYAKF